MQNKDLPEPLIPLTKQENGRLNLRSSLVDNSLNIDLRMTLGGSILSYLYPNGTDVLSCSCRLLKNDVLYPLSQGFVIIETTPPLDFLLRVINFCLCTFTCSFSVFPLNQVLNDLKIDESRSVIIQRYSSNFIDRLSLACHGINNLVGIVFSSALTNSSIICEVLSSEVMAPRLSPISTRAGSSLGWTNMMLSESQCRARCCILSRYEYRCSRAPDVTYQPMTSFV